MALIANALLASCTSGEARSGAEAVEVTVCPEAIRISARGNPIGVISGHIRHCWPGEARCFCDRDDDCYAEEGYVACIPPSDDAGADDVATVDASTSDTAVADTGSNDAEPVDAVIDSGVIVDVENDAALDVNATDTTAVDSGVIDSGVVDGSPVRTWFYRTGPLQPWIALKVVKVSW